MFACVCECIFSLIHFCTHFFCLIFTSVKCSLCEWWLMNSDELTAFPVQCTRRFPFHRWINTTNDFNQDLLSRVAKARCQFNANHYPLEHRLASVCVLVELRFILKIRRAVAFHSLLCTGRRIFIDGMKMSDDKKNENLARQKLWLSENISFKSILSFFVTIM